MPVDDHGLSLVNEFITTNGIEKMSLAAKYDVAKNVMLDTLSGRLRTPQAHKIILKIIDDFKLRWMQKSTLQSASLKITYN